MKIGMTGKAGFADLKRAVIDARLCTRCGGCAGSCPVRCLDMGPEGVELVGECIGCGTCLSVCPGGSIDISAHEKRLFGREHGKREKLQGSFISRQQLVASDREVFRSGYFGGRVSALLIHMLGSGDIDAALLTDFSCRDGILSTGTGVIARTRDEMLSCSGSKYLFSPVLMHLREVSEDPDIGSAAIVCLPCQAHALRNMEVHPATKHLTDKISLVIGLNCGATNVDEKGWHRVIGDIMTIRPDEISRVDIRRIKRGRLRIGARSRKGVLKVKDVSFSGYSTRTLSEGIWPRCRLCMDYSCYLSDITFGSPIIRTERGVKAIEKAVGSGSLRRALPRRIAAQWVIDNFAGRRKIMGASWRIRRNRAKGRPHPEYI